MAEAVYRAFILTEMCYLERRESPTLLARIVEPDSRQQGPLTLTGGTVMSALRIAPLQCPYCWEKIEVVVDCSLEEQEYIEDCSVCCRPIVISAITADGEVVSVEGRSEDD